VVVSCDDGGNIAPPAVEPPASVRVVPSTVTYGVGDSVVAEVHIDSATNVGAVTLRLRYDPAVLEYVSGVEGTFMNGDGSHTVFLTGAAAGGEIAVGLTRIGRQGASGTGLLFTLEFLAVGAGDAGFDIAEGAVKDPQARNLPAVFSTVPVVVVP